MNRRVLIVEDSAFMRRIISDIIEKIQGLELVGIARDGIDALDVIPLYRPDIITLDIEMPRMDGLETLKRIKEDYEDIPVVMLSSLSKTESTMEALQMGAEDFIEKPKSINENMDDFRRELELKIKSVVDRSNKVSESVFEKDIVQEKKEPGRVDAIVIAASTGGPKALDYIVSRLPADMDKPIFIVQHMPANFTKSFANRLNQDSRVSVCEAEDGMKIEKGKVYLAPGDYHMTIEDGSLKLDGDRPKILGVRPAADYLFISASQYYKERLVGVVLTGMGRDGTEGMRAIKDQGGYNIVQDEKTSVIFGMPESAIANKLVHEVLSLDDISRKINRILR